MPVLDRRLVFVLTPLVFVGCVLGEYSAADIGSNTTVEEAGAGSGGEGGPTGEGGTSNEGGTTSEGGTTNDGGTDGAMPFDAGPSVCGGFTGAPLGGFCDDFEGDIPPPSWSITQESSDSITRGMGRVSISSVRFEDKTSAGASYGVWLSRPLTPLGSMLVLQLDFIVDAVRDGGKILSFNLNNNSYELVLDSSDGPPAIVATSGGKASKKSTSRALTSGWHQLRFQLNTSTGVGSATLDGTSFLPSATFETGSSSGTLMIGAFMEASQGNRSSYATVRFDDALFTSNTPTH